MAQGFSVRTTDGIEGEQKLLSLLSRTRGQVFLVLAAIFLTYLHTLNIPFYFDDFTSLRDNAAIRDFGSVWDFSRARIVGYLSFALNYALHGYQLWGYHLLNILIHAAASLTAYFLTRWILATRESPYCSDSARTWLPLLVALLFALHPLQTQAVTYIIQRLASLAALFYLLAMAAYLRGRLVEAGKQQVLSFGLAGLFALLALFTKQNTVTLPLALLLLEICLLRPRKEYLLGLIGVGAAGLLVAA